MSGRIRAFSRGLLVLAAYGGLFAWGQTPPPVGPPPKGAAPQEIGESFRSPQGALIAPGKAPDASLLFTGDVLGYVDPCG